MLKSFIDKSLSTFGYKIIKRTNWRPKHNFEILELGKDVRENILKNTMLNESRLINIVLISTYLVESKVQGDFVECGVWKGGSVALMAYYLKTKKEERYLHLFDCFDDICQPDSKIDGEKAIKEAGGADFANGSLIPLKGIYDHKGGSGNEANVTSLLIDQIGYSPCHVIIHKGWFQDTLPRIGNKITQIALLRLDGDWYASTKICLENLYDKVVIGGVIIVDDYGCYEGCKKAVDEFLFQNNIKPFLIKVDDECIYWIKS